MDITGGADIARNCVESRTMHAGITAHPCDRTADRLGLAREMPPPIVSQPDDTSRFALATGPGTSKHQGALA
jgi:hypothetical protein